MVARAFSINTWHACAAGLAQQIIAGQPPAHGAVQQQRGVVGSAFGIGHPDHQVDSLRIERMAQVLTKVARQCLVLGHGVLRPCGQSFKGLVQQVSTKALGESRVGHCQGLGYGPGLIGGIRCHRVGSMSIAMGKLCQRKGTFATAKPGICLEGFFAAELGVCK